MTETQEQDFAQMDREKQDATRAKIQKKVYEKELRHAELVWLKENGRLSRAIDLCNLEIKRVNQWTA